MNRPWMRRLGVIGLAAVGAAGLAACEAPGLELVVTTTADGADANPGDGVCEMSVGVGNCSLRAAIDEANAPANPDQEIITFADGVDVITLTGAAGDDANASGDLDILDGIKIDGGINGVIIDANEIDRAFDVHGGADPLPFVDISRLTVRDGRAAEGAGIRLTGGAQATTLDSVLVTNNLATSAGGGVYVGAGSDLTLNNSTIGYNASLGTGAGVWSAGKVVAQYTTVAQAYTTGSALHRDAAASGVFQIGATVVGSPLGSTACSGTITSADYNVVHDSSCGLAGANDQVADPLLGALADNFGPTDTYALSVSSLAFDVVPFSTFGCGAPVDDDGRGYFRPNFGGCDAGAFEIQPAPE